MNVTLTIKKEFDIKTVNVNVHIRHIGAGDGDIPEDFPLLDGENWVANIDVDTGIIQGWPVGDDRTMHVKVCDEGIYTLIDANGKEVSQIDGYVPNSLIPGEYGDYIDMTILSDGKIAEWNPSFEDFLAEE